MRIFTQNIFTRLENLYMEFTSSHIEFVNRKELANQIASEIIDYILNQNNRKDLLNSINLQRQNKMKNEKINAPNYNQKPYYNELIFLSSNEFIPLKLEPALNFLLRAKYKNQLPAKIQNSKSNESQFSLHEMVNMVLLWFLEENDESQNYIVPVEYIEQKHQSSIQNNYIKSFFNIKSFEKNWFKKYQTLIAYLTIVFLSFLLIHINNEYISILSDFVFALIIVIILLIITTICFFNTFYYVVNRRIRCIRYIFLSIMPIIFGYYIYSSFLDYINSFSNNEIIHEKLLDADPNVNGDGFIYITKDPYFYFDSNPDVIDFNDLVTNENGNKIFNLDIHIKNIDNLKNDYIDSLNLIINHSFIDDDLRFDVQVHGKTNSIFDIIRIKNFTPSKNQLYTLSPSKIIYQVRKGENAFQDSIVYSKNIVDEIILKNKPKNSKSWYNIPSSKKDIYKIIYSFQMGIAPRRTKN